MLRVAAFAGGGLEFLCTLSARLLILYARRTVVPVIQGCTGWVMLTCNVTYSWWFAFSLYGGGVSITADVAKTLDQRSLREARVYGVNRKFMGHINR